MQTWLTSAFLLLIIPVPVAGQNLVENGDFDSDLTGWYSFNATGGVVSWDRGDSEGNPLSGSAHVVNLTSDPDLSGAGLQIAGIPVNPGAVYRLRIHALVERGQATSADVTAELLFYRTIVGEFCSDFTIVHDWVPNITTTGAWATSSLVLRAPSDAHCGRIAPHPPKRASEDFLSA